MPKKLPKKELRTIIPVKMNLAEKRKLPKTGRSAFIRDAIDFANERKIDFNQWRKSREKAE